MKVFVLLALTAALFGSTATALPQTAPPSSTRFPPAGMQFEKPFLDYLLPAIKQTGEPARIYLDATCSVSDGSFEDALNGNIGFVYRDVDVDLSPASLTGVSAIKHLLQNDPKAIIRQAPSGLLRITIGDVPTAILQTKISRLALSKYAQYTALSTVDELLNAPELLEAEHRSHVRLRNHLVDHLVGWGRGPHLPPMLEGITIDQALDVIAQTFNGIVIYGACQMPDGGSWFVVRFVYEPSN